MFCVYAFYKLTLFYFLESGSDSYNNSDDDSVENDRNADEDSGRNADNNQAFLSGMLPPSIFLNICTACCYHI